MPIPGSILSNRLNTSLSRSMYPSLLTIQDKNETTDGSGSPVPGTPTNVIGLVDLPCRVAPLILIRPTDKEDRVSSITRQDVDRQITIFGNYYSLIDPAIQQAVVGSDVFRILGKERDGDDINTRLKVQIVRP